MPRASSHLISDEQPSRNNNGPDEDRLSIADIILRKSECSILDESRETALMKEVAILFMKGFEDDGSGAGKEVFVSVYASREHDRLGPGTV